MRWTSVRPTMVGPSLVRWSTNWIGRAAWPCRSAWRAATCARSAAGRAGQRRRARSGRRRPVIMGDHGLAIDQERRRLDAERSVNNGREAVRPVMAVACKAADARGPSGVRGSLCRIRFAGPIFRFGQNPVLGFCFGREVSDMRVRTISCLYRNEPATGFYHFRHKVGDHLSHCRNMRRDRQWRRMAVWLLIRRYTRTFGVGHKFCL